MTVLRDSEGREIDLVSPVVRELKRIADSLEKLTECIGTGSWEDRAGVEHEIKFLRTNQ